MPVYAHGCARRTPDASSHRDDPWWVCDACLPDYAPRCSLCDAPSPVVRREAGFRGHAFGKLCPTCVERVRAEGSWPERRARATAAKRDALLARFPGLSVTVETRAQTRLDGVVEDRRVQIRMRRGSREGAWPPERYVVHVELLGDATPGPSPPIPGLEEAWGPTPAKVTVDRGRWLRIGFLHMGRLDPIRVIEEVLEAARGLDGGRGPSDSVADSADRGPR